MLSVLLAALALLASACGTSGPLRASVVQFHLEPLPAMVARKVELPLYLVVGPNDVPETVHIPGMQILIFTIPDVDLLNVRTFATRDIVHALEPYFATIQVVYSEKELPKTPHIHGQIKMTKAEYDRQVRTGHDGAQINVFFGALEWAFGLQVSGQPDFLFSFSERSESSEPMKGFEDTSQWASTFQEAMRHMLAEYNKQSVQQKLVQLSLPDPYTN